MKNIFNITSKLIDKKKIRVIFAQKIFFSEYIIFSTNKNHLNVALAYNVKPESDAFIQSVSPIRKNSKVNTQLITQDMFAEWDTIETITAVKDALSVYHNVTMVEADLNAFEKFKEISPDIVFNIAEGFYGISREAQIPAMLDMLNIPYTGSDPLTLSVCLDKSRAKEILTYYNIPNAKFKVVDSLNEIDQINLNFPVIVKPIAEGSGKGIYSSSFVNSREELSREAERILLEYNQPALVEEYLAGREFTVAILGNGNEAKALPVIEIDFSPFPENFVPIYSYEAKWILDTKDNQLDIFSCPAKIDDLLEEKIKKVSLAAFKVLKCKDWSRIDLRLDASGEPHIIEINPLPGILPDPKENSCFPKAARAAGMNYETMINSVLFAAAKRYGLV